jgi:hypothetical protein
VLGADSHVGHALAEKSLHVLRTSEKMGKQLLQ